MDHKPWQWRRKASEKTITARGRVSLSLQRNVEEDQENEIGSLKCRSILSDRLPSVVCHCNAKDDLIREHRRIAEQALAGQEMERSEAAYLKRELDKALEQGEAAERKLALLNAAMKDCKQEIEFLRLKHDESVQNDFSKAKVDFEKEHKKMEAKVAEANKRILNLSAENANLMKALICKERLLLDLDKGKAELESELDVLTSKLDTVETENSFLKYEFHALEKEFELQNEELNYNRRSAMENEKQISKLEAECQQLRHLVRKRLQVDVQGTDQAGMRRKKLNPTTGNNTSEKPVNGTSFLIERVYSLEEENMTLREILALSDSEIHSCRIKYGKMASRLAEVEAELQEVSGVCNPMQLAISGTDLSEYGGNGNSEMEKYTVVTPSIEVQGSENQLRSSGNELVLVSTSNSISHRTDKSFTEHSSWLDEILKVILEEHQGSRRNIGELLQDIKIALGKNGSTISNSNEKNYSEFAGFLTWESSDSTCINPIPEGIHNQTSIEDKNAFGTEDPSFARERIKKHFCFNRSKSDNRLEPGSSNSHNTLAQMLAIQTSKQEENRQMQEKLQRTTEGMIAQKDELQESKQTIASLQEELESLRESKGLIEEQIENQRLINEDLNTQLTVAKSKLNEILHKVSSLEVELDHKNNCCEELEATCLELQLELETLSRNESPNTDIDKMAMKLLDNAFCPTTAIVVHTPPVSNRKTLAAPRFSLRDRLLEKEDDQTEHPNFLKREETVSKQDENPGVYLALPAPEPKVQSPEQVVNMALVPIKKAGGGFGFIRKLFLRRNRSHTKMKATHLQRNTSALMKQRDALLLA